MRNSATKNSHNRKAVIRRKQKWNHADWKNAFTPVKKRIVMKHMLQYLSVGVLSALGGILLMIGVSFLLPIENLWLYCLAIGLTAVAIVLTVGLMKRPSTFEAARAIDKLGLQEKVLTACELDDKDDRLAVLQREDAIKALSRFDKKRISLQVPKTHGATFLILAAALVFVNLIPNPMDLVIQERKELKAEIEEQLEDLRETEKELAAEEAITAEQRQELAELVDELSAQLKKTGDYKEALKKISKAEDELAALTDKIREDSIGNLVQQLGALEDTHSLAQALTSRNLSDLESGLEQLKEQLQQGVNKEELAENLKEALDKAMESMSEGSIKDSLAAASKSLSNGQTGIAADQMGEAMKQAVKASNAMGDAKYALQQMRTSVAQAAGESQYAQNTGNQSGQTPGDSGQETNSGQNGQGNQGEGQGQGTGEGQGSGEGAGEGQGEGNGQGQGTGQGQGQGSGQGTGSGVGNGTTNQGSGQGNNGSTGQTGNNQTGDPNAQTVYEQIYAPERLGDGGDITQVPGQNTGNGGVTSVDDGRGVGNLSGYIPYQEIYQEYRNEAMNSMDRRVLPPNVQDMVRKYFDSIGD